MSLCLRSFRAVHAPHVASVFCSSRSAHRYLAPPFRHAKDSNQPKALAHSKLATRRVEQVASDQDVPLGDLTDEELIKLINQAVKSRNQLPIRATRIPGSSRSFPAGRTCWKIHTELRRRGTHSLTKLFSGGFATIAEFALNANQRDLLNLVIDDSLAIALSFKEDGIELVERQYRALERLLHVAVERLDRTSNGTITPRQYSQVIDLSNVLLLGRRSGSIQPTLTLGCLNGLVRSIVSRTSECDASLLEALFRYVQSTTFNKADVSPQRVTGSSTSAERIHDFLLWHLLCLIHSLISKGMNELSFSFLQVLVRRGLIPPQAINKSGSRADVRTFTLSVLLRTCAYYGWPDRALQLLRSEDLNEAEFRDYYTNLVNDLLSTFLVNDAKKLQQCSELITHVVSQNPEIELNGHLIRIFFKIARDAKAGKAAETMYAAVQATPTRARYTDGPFHEKVLPWLLSHLVYRSRRRYLGKRLVQDLVNGTRPVNLYERGDVIALCAAGGYIAEARALWERYAVGSEGKMVVGHAQCMVGIVKLFKSVSDTIAKNAEADDGRDGRAASETKRGKTDVNGIHGCSANRSARTDGTQDAQFDAPVQEDIVGEVLGTVRAPESSCPSHVEKSDQFSVSNVYAVDDLQTNATDVSKSAISLRHGVVEDDTRTTIGIDSAERSSASDPVTRKQPASDESRAEEHFAFALKVLDAFRSAKEPLHWASHHDLNALARASDVLGFVRDSMRALQILIERKEVPDTHDLNVVVTAMASRDLLRAEAMLVRMLTEGMHLNAISFSAVIMEALRHGDTECASRTYSRAVRAGHKELPLEAAGALLMACLDVCSPSRPPTVAQSGRERELHKTFLRQAYTLCTIETYAKAAMPHDLGARCIGAALRFGEPGLAYLFWKLLMKRKARWNSDNHKEIRQTISVAVGKVLASGGIEANEGRQMLSELDGEK